MEWRQQYLKCVDNNLKCGDNKCVEGLETSIISYRQHSTFCWQVNSLLVVKVILEVLVNWRQLLQNSTLRVHSEVLKFKSMAYQNDKMINCITSNF